MNTSSANDRQNVPWSDQSLLRRFQDGEDDAATAIYLRYAKRLQQLAASQTGRELAVRLDPEDIVQSVFRTFFRRAAEGHYHIPDGEELWKLFLVIALNKIRSLGEYHRAVKRNVRSTKAFGHVERYLSSPESDDQRAFRMLQWTIEDVMSQLGESERQIVSLRIEGHDINSIAASTGRAKRSVERILQQFRQNLSKHLNDE